MLPRKESARYVLSPIYPRMLGYTISLAMYSINAVHMIKTFKGDVLNDPDVKQFCDDQFKFLTMWNMYMQMFYAVLGLSCDLLSHSKWKGSSFLKILEKIRDPLFTSVICPFSFTVFFVFWTVFSYDRSLILPPSVDRTLSGRSNHILHTAIVPVVLWEITFRPRSAPETHVPNLVLMNIYATAYIAVLVTSYLTLGTWVYPILNMLDGTIYLHLFLGAAVISAQLFYCLQWYLTDLAWNNRVDIVKKVN